MGGARVPSVWRWVRLVGQASGHEAFRCGVNDRSGAAAAGGALLGTSQNGPLGCACPRTGGLGEGASRIP